MYRLYMMIIFPVISCADPEEVTNGVQTLHDDYISSDKLC